MEEEVKGYQVETCFGPTGCPNRAVDWEISKMIEDLLEKMNLKKVADLLQSKSKLG